MKTRYTTIAGLEWWEADGKQFIARTVHEIEPRVPVKTGILDASGTPIYKVEVLSPIGFVVHRP